MKLKQLWHSSLIWVLLLWCILSLIYHCSLLVVTIGAVIWVSVVFLMAPGVFWNYLSLFSFDQHRKEQWLVKAVSYNPQILQPYMSLAMIYIRQKRWTETVEVLKAAIGLDNSRSGFNAKILLTIAYRESGSYDKAIEILIQLTEQGIQSFIIYFNLATTYFKLGRLEQALAAAEKARSFDVKSSQPVLLMGRVHFELREFQKAKDDYEWSIKHISWPVESYYWLGRAELELGETEAAREHLKVAVTRIKDDPDMSDVTLPEAEEWLTKIN
jgi:tetratricopeptide (TPR) repeat protein